MAGGAPGVFQQPATAGVRDTVSSGDSSSALPALSALPTAVRRLLEGSLEDRASDGDNGKTDPKNRREERGRSITIYVCAGAGLPNTGPFLKIILIIPIIIIII